jgi:hypothetical protein
MEKQKLDATQNLSKTYALNFTFENVLTNSLIKL